MKHIPTGRPLYSGFFSKLAIGTWRRPRDPSTYLQLDLDVEPVLAYLKVLSARHQRSFSITHVFGKVLGLCMARYPELNLILRGTTLRRRQGVSVFFSDLTRAKGRSDLFGISISDPEKKTLLALADEHDEKVRAIRCGHDEELTRAHRMLACLPSLFRKSALACLEWVMYRCNISLNNLGLPRDRFGSVMITSLGAFGMPLVFPPLFPFSRCGIIVSIGKIELRPWIVSGRVVPRKLVSLGITVDHRLLHGAYGAKPIRFIKHVFKNPSLYF